MHASAHPFSGSGVAARAFTPSEPFYIETLVDRSRARLCGAREKRAPQPLRDRWHDASQRGHRRCSDSAMRVAVAITPPLFLPHPSLQRRRPPCCAPFHHMVYHRPVLRCSALHRLITVFPSISLRNLHSRVGFVLRCSATASS